MKKKILLLISFLCSCQIGATQTLKRIGVLERKNNTLFIAEGSHRFLVKQEVVTVKLKKGPISMSTNKNKIRSNRLGFVDLAVPIGIDIESYVSSLEKSRNFEVVEYNSIGEYCLTTNDTEVNRQWYLSSINLFNAWDFTMGNSNTTVAILDSGTDWRHPDLGNGTDGYKNIDETLGWNYITGNSNVITNNGHGTRVAGIVGAKSNNSRGIAGVSGGNNNVGITMIPFCVGIAAPDGSVIDDAIIDAVDRGVRIIQLSLSIGQTNAINAAIEYAHQNNVVVVCAAGNYSSSTVSYPASHPNVIAVGGTDKNNRRAPFAQYGQNLDVVAPAVGIYSTALNNNYNSEDGTSFAAPQVSGVAALILSVRPDLTGQQVRNVIEQTAQKVGGYSYATTSGRPNGTWNQEMGYGLVDAYAAVYAVAPRLSGPTSVCNQATYTIKNLPQGATVQWSSSNNSMTLQSGQGTATALFRQTGFTNAEIRAAVRFNGATIANLAQAITICQPSISGPASVCNQATYTVENLPQGATVRWSVSNSNVATISNNGVLRVTNQTFALTNVEANIFTGGNEFTIRKECVMTGQPKFEIQPLGYSGSNFASFFLTPQGEYGDLQSIPLNYRWSYTRINGSGYTLIGYYPNTTFLNIQPVVTFPGPGTYMITVEITGYPCSIPLARYEYSCGSNFFTLSPNPATDVVTLQLMETDEVSGSSVLSTDRSAYEIQIWSGMTMLRSFRTNEPTFQIPMAGLPAGLYFVRVVKDGQTYTQKLIKK